MSVVWAIVRITGEIAIYGLLGHYLWITRRSCTVKIPGGVIRTSKRLNRSERAAVERLYALILRDYDKRARK